MQNLFEHLTDNFVGTAINEDADQTNENVNSESEFKEYGHTVLKQAHGDDYDETKANQTIDGIIAQVDGDWGAAVGMLTSGFGK